MGLLFMQNYNRTVEPLLPTDLSTSISDVIPCEDLKLKTGYGVLTQLSLDAHEELASKLLRWYLIYGYNLRKGVKV